MCKMHRMASDCEYFVFSFSSTKLDQKTLPTGRTRTRGIHGERENEERGCQKTGAGKRVSRNVFETKILSE